MATELLANNFSVLLTASCSAGQSTISVSAAAPSALQGGQFRIVVDQEYMLVTSGQNTTTWTVSRGVEGSTATSHQNGALAVHILTAGSLAALAGVTLDTTASDIQPLGTQAAGSVGKAADAGHVHAMPSLDQVGAPAANVAMNSKKLTGLANGSASSDAAAFGQIPAALPPNGSAGGDLSGSYPNPAVAKVNGTSVPATPSAGQVLQASSGSAAAWAYPPGYEWSYTPITASANVTATSDSASATAIISPGAFTPDGGALYVEFFCPFVVYDTAAAGDVLGVALYEGSTEITALLRMSTQSSSAPIGGGHTARYRFTPTNAAHTYTIRAWATSTTGTPAIGAGTGGVGAWAPAYVRFVKA